jgi:hypothetical protein
MKRGIRMEEYNFAFDILTEALQKMGTAGITKDEVLPHLVDFTATVAVAMAGAEGIEACIIRLGDRIKDYRDGIFPVNPAAAD